MSEIIKTSTDLLPDGYDQWRKDIEHLIDTAKLKTAISVNMGTLSLYWNIGKQIIEKQEQMGWGKQVIAQLSKDLCSRFPNDRGYSERNLRNMKRFAEAYATFPIWQTRICTSSACANYLVSSYIPPFKGKRRSTTCLLYNGNCTERVESRCNAPSDRQWIYPRKGACYQQL